MICKDESLLTPELAQHIASGKPLVENVFRYGSDAWVKLICDARRLYHTGYLDDIDVDDLMVLEGQVGRKVIHGDQLVMLEVPEVNWNRPGWNYVYVLHDNEVMRVDFEAEPVTAS